MYYWLKQRYLLVFIIIAGCKTQPDVQLVPVETFFKNSQRVNYNISPNGEYLAFLQNRNDQLNVFVRQVDDTTSVQLTALNNVSVRNVSWLGDHKLFCEKGKDTLNGFGAFLINKDGTKYFEIERKPGTRINMLDNNLHNGTTVLVTTNERDEALFDVYQLNIETGQKKLMVKNPGNIFLWFADDKGDVNLGIGGDDVNETIYFRRNMQEPFKALISNNFKSTLKPLGYTKNNRYIYALSNLNRDKLALVEFDCLTGKESKLLYQNADADISEVLFLGSSAEPASVTYETSRRKTYFLDEDYRNVYSDISNKLPNREIEIIDKDALGLNLVLKAYTDKNPGGYFLYNVKQETLKKLSAINPEIDPNKMCEMKPISYQTKDGLTIHGYLTLPIGKKKRKLPCVVLPHNGPSSRDVWGYAPEVQFLANRGYAVLQVNYRGSAGYGKLFENVGFKQWGGKIQDDIFEGVTWLINEGIADPQRVGVFGYRFGGFSALNQVIAHSNTYKCAASYSGHINLFTYIKGFPSYSKPYRLMLNEIVGDPETDTDYLEKASPIFQIEKIKAPILIAQGGKDSRVNVNETTQFVKELRKRKVPVSYILFEREKQYFRNEEHQFSFYRHLEIFLDKYLKN